MGKSTISMAIFNSYVGLPEGIWFRVIQSDQKSICRAPKSDPDPAVGWEVKNLTTKKRAGWNRSHPAFVVHIPFYPILVWSCLVNMAGLVWLKSC